MLDMTLSILKTILRTFLEANELHIINIFFYRKYYTESKKFKQNRKIIRQKCI